MIRVYAFGVRSRAAAIALVALAFALGAVFVAFGIVLLLGLAAVGTLAGAGVLLFRALTGRRVGRISAAPADHGLDPSLEVFSARSETRTPPRPLTSPRRREIE